ncbi:MAG: peptide chain release factor 1 [Planctomycetota bacterium]|jgi:peptide chain release factor 1|nr:peptide chain release factor 1 [Planctomycetota bacterium]
MLDAKVKEKLDGRLDRFRELDRLLADPAVGSDPRIGDYMRERGTLATAMDLYQSYLAADKELRDSLEIAGDASQDKELRELAATEIPGLEEKLGLRERELVDMLLGRNADSGRNAILEIRAGTGGEEAALFAGDLFRMYRNFADGRGWKYDAMAVSGSERGGFKEVIVSVEGENAYRDLRMEGGGHRVQRVPETEAQGRVHTSAATVAVMPEAEEYEVEIRPEELEISIQCSGGPGGQSVNTTQSSVRIIHVPTGITVFMQEEKSQHKNKAKAMRVLRSRLYEMKKAEEDAKRAAERRGQTGSGDRSERVRTYNFPQDRCTDHRLGKNFPLADIMEGKLDKLVAELVEYGKQLDLRE